MSGIIGNGKRQECGSALVTTQFLCLAQPTDVECAPLLSLNAISSDGSLTYSANAAATMWNGAFVRNICQQHRPKSRLNDRIAESGLLGHLVGPKLLDHLDWRNESTLTVSRAFFLRWQTHAPRQPGCQVVDSFVEWLCLQLLFLFSA